MRLSIRWRLTLWNLAVLAVALVGMGGLVYGLMWQTLYQRIDRSLQTYADFVKREYDLAARHAERRGIKK